MAYASSRGVLDSRSLGTSDLEILLLAPANLPCVSHCHRGKPTMHSACWRASSGTLAAKTQRRSTFPTLSTRCVDSENARTCSNTTCFCVRFRCSVQSAIVRRSCSADPHPAPCAHAATLRAFDQACSLYELAVLQINQGGYHEVRLNNYSLPNDETSGGDFKRHADGVPLLPLNGLGHD